MKVVSRGVGLVVAATLLSLMLALTACGDGTETSGAATAAATPEAAGPASGSIIVEVGEQGGANYMTPTDITVPAGQEVTIVVKNKGAAVHNLHIYAKKGGDSIAASDPLAIQPGTEGRIVVKFDKPGTYFWQCDFHPEIQGTVTVQ